jgi:hypothetical protein
MTEPNLTFHQREGKGNSIPEKAKNSLGRFALMNLQANLTEEELM